MKSRSYLRFIHTYPCIAARTDPRHCAGPVHAHHIRAGHGGEGMALKPSDFDAVACCQAHHQTGEHAYHTLGHERWLEAVGLDELYVERWMRRAVNRFLEDLIHLVRDL